MRPCDLFLFAGEPSGDKLGADLIASLLKRDPSLSITAVAGPEMRRFPIKTYLPMEEFQVMGFGDILSHLPRLARLFPKVRNKILEENPSIFLSIDYPGWNLQLAKSLRKHRFPGKICHYVCPSIWAWKKNRKEKMEKHLDALLTLFPFEAELFVNSPLQSHFVGHPLTKQFIDDKQRACDKKISHLALFPGSRIKEIQRNLPLQLQAAKQLEKQYGISFSIALAHENLQSTIEQIAPGEEICPPSQKEELLAKTDMAIAKLGTITLELALAQIPSVITFGLSRLDRFLAEKIFRILLPHYALPNILLQRQIFTELIGPFFTKETLLSATEYLVENRQAYRECVEGCREVKKILQVDEDNCATDAILSLLDLNEKHQEFSLVE